ncbi:unnamed protein product, partial [Staurois parvus]
MTQGPHDPLLPGGSMSCQSAPATRPCSDASTGPSNSISQNSLSFWTHQ